MCKFASFVLTKYRELWLPESDSHTEIIERYGLHADGSTGPNIVKVEIVPGPKIKKFSDYRNWVFRVDQDVLPAWHDPKETEARTRAALRRRAKEGFLKVDASGCTALVELKAEAAKTVYASGCTALVELKAEAADYVDASGCTALVVYPKKVTYR